MPDTTTRSSRRWLGAGGIITLGLLVLAGLAGLDRVFYEHVSLRLNTARPFDHDFYTLTRPLWLLLRTGFAHAIGCAVAYVLVVALHPQRWRAANRLALAVCGAVVATFVLESVIGRVRPNRADDYLTFRPLATLVQWHDREVCFPSGEAALAFTLAIGLSRLFPRLRKLFYTLAVLASIARLVNGAHYVSDVAAGALLGLLCGRIVYAWLSTSGPQVSKTLESP